ncbi:MAG: hypothetical protein WB985_17975 [Candidatus Acidiferrales bacterium]
MRNFVFTLFAIEILHRAFGNPRTCLSVVFWRWMLGGLDDRPRVATPTQLRDSRVTRIDQPQFALAERRAAWEHRFNLLADTIASMAA